MTITFLKTSKTIWNNLDEITADFYMNFLLIKLPNMSKYLKRVYYLWTSSYFKDL